MNTKLTSGQGAGRKGVVTSSPETFSVRLADPARRALRRAAQQDGRSVSNLVQRILTEWLRAGGHLSAGDTVTTPCEHPGA
jgi:hypothetical protein